jgi:hypothetical protein
MGERERILVVDESAVSGVSSGFPNLFWDVCASREKFVFSGSRVR